MKITIPTTVTKNVKWLRITIPINYGDEDMPFDFPQREGDVWNVLIDMEEGKIKHWPAGFAYNLFVTVKDGGTYRLYDDNGIEIASIEEYYVPNDVIPGEFDDVIKLDIAADGTITNWIRNPNFSAFLKDTQE